MRMYKGLIIFLALGAVQSAPGKKKGKPSKSKPAKCYDSDSSGSSSILCLWTGKSWNKDDMETCSSSSIECTYDKYRDRSPPYSDDE